MVGEFRGKPFERPRNEKVSRGQWLTLICLAVSSPLVNPSFHSIPFLSFLRCNHSRQESEGGVFCPKFMDCSLLVLSTLLQHFDPFHPSNPIFRCPLRKMSQASPPVAPSAPPAVEEEIKSSDPIQTPAVAAVNAEPEGSVQEVPQQSPQQLPARTDTATFMGRLTQRQLTDLKRAFDRFDTDKSGSIDAAELAFILKALGQTPTQGELLDMLNEVDQDGNGTIEFDEFCRMMVQRGPSAGVDKEDTLEAFRVFDSGRSSVSASLLLPLPVVFIFLLFSVLSICNNDHGRCRGQWKDPCDRASEGAHQPG